MHLAYASVKRRVAGFSVDHDTDPKQHAYNTTQARDKADRTKDILFLAMLTRELLGPSMDPHVEKLLH